MILTVPRKLTDYIWMFALANSFRVVVRLFGMLIEPMSDLSALHAVPIMSPSSQNNKEQMTQGARAKISYHQTRGCYVQRSEYGFHPGGRLRSRL